MVASQPLAGCRLEWSESVGETREMKAGEGTKAGLCGQRAHLVASPKTMNQFLAQSSFACLFPSFLLMSNLLDVDVV